MHRFFYTSLFSFLLLTLFCSLPASATGQDNISRNTLSTKKQYQQAKFYYNELQTNTTLGKNRENWMRGVGNFRKIYLSGPKSDYAAPSLYMLGKMYLKMYRRFNNQVDLQESISYYHDVAALFPDNNLADDALYAAGTLYLNKKNDPQRAAEAFNRIISDHRNGDMYANAAESLKKLSKEHNIPLPAAMLRRTYLENLTNVLPVKYWSSNNYTRVVINASGPVTYRETLLEKDGNHPRRLYLDFQESYIDPKFRAPVPIEDGLLKRIRTGQFTPETVRVVLDIESISSYKIFSLPDPFRVVIDVRGEPTAQSVAPAKTLPEPPAAIGGKENNPAKQEAALIILEDFKKKSVGANAVTEVPVVEEPPAPKEAISLAQQLGLGVRKIVIDPGHGGKDPGASAFGLIEKDIVLQIARKVAPRLRGLTGAEVILTRDSDIFIPLEERTAIANTNDADLFVSLHINAHPSEKVHGLETYYLNLSTNAEAMRVAAFENATSTHQMSDLQDILSDIMKNSKINESSRLAGFVHNTLSDGINDVQGKGFKNLGVKQAPFYVLIGAEMPAILIEIGFITNPNESALLNQDEFLSVVAEEIAKGIESYVQSTHASL